MPVSYSRANSFEECPARFKAEHIDKIKAPEPLYFTVGRFMHDVMDAYVKKLIWMKVQSDFALAAEIFEAAWSKRGNIPEALYPDLYDMLCKGREMVVLEDPAQVVGSEIDLALTDGWTKTTWLAKDVFLRMKIDRLDVRPDWTVVVVDYKTGHSIEDAQGSMQLKLYGLGVKTLVPNAGKIEARLLYLRNRAVSVCEVADADIEEARRWILAVSERIEAARRQDAWPATPGRACANCPLFDGCEARKKATSDLPPTNGEEAAALLARWILVDKERKDLKERLQAWISVNGPISHNGMTARLSPVIAKKLPVGALSGILEKAGEVSSEYLKADEQALRELVRRRPDLEHSIEAIATNSATARFDVKKEE